MEALFKEHYMDHGIIIRGTTPTIEFKFKTVAPTDIKTAFLYLKQNNEIIIEKDITSATIKESSMEWKLTQEETLRLTSRRNVSIVCDWLLQSDTRGRSCCCLADVGDPGKDEVME
jgi:hypothetical protein